MARPRPPRPARAVGVRGTPAAVLATALALVTAGCSAAGGSPAPTWVPGPGAMASEGPGAVRIQPLLPGQATGAPGSGSTAPAQQPSGGSSQSPSGTSQQDPLVVATRLTTPVGLTLLPDGSALVGERTTGRIVRVQPTAGQPTPTVKTLTGLSTAGGGGLLDLAISPDYAQDNLIYAYLTTATDNRVVEFTLDGPVTPVLTGIPRGVSDNAGRIDFGPDGDLYVGTGTADGSTAGSPASLAGKVLRVDDLGRPARDNPDPASAVFTSGHVALAGLCPVGQTGRLLEVEPGRVNQIVGGDDYGSGGRPAIAGLPAVKGHPTAPGDCAVQDDRLWVTSPDGQSLLSATLSGSGSAVTVGTFSSVLAGRYGRLLTVVPATDGALWLTTTNRDGHGTPVADDERVIRYVPSASSQAGSQL